MKIYGCYSGKDLKSYFCELTLADPTKGVTLPTFRLTFGGARKQTGSWQDLHVSTGWGSMTVVQKGQVEFGVTGGSVRSVIGYAGDIFIFVDTEGDGHSTHNPDTGILQVANLRFLDPVQGFWNTLQSTFKGWPDNVLPPEAYTPGGPSGGRHDKLDPNFDMSRFSQPRK